MVHYMLGEEEPARIALQKAADANANFPGKDEARQRLALLAINVETANSGMRTELENYLRERPSDPAALLRLAQVQERDGAIKKELGSIHAKRQHTQKGGRLNTDTDRE